MPVQPVNNTITKGTFKTHRKGVTTFTETASSLDDSVFVGNGDYESVWVAAVHDGTRVIVNLAHHDEIADLKYGVTTGISLTNGEMAEVQISRLGNVAFYISSETGSTTTCDLLIAGGKRVLVD